MAITIKSGSRRDFTATDYASLNLPDQSDMLGGVNTIRQDGGNVCWFFLGTASPVWGDIYGIDTSAAFQVIQQPTSNTQRRLGVLVGQLANGRGVFGPNAFATEFGAITVGTTRVFIQTSGPCIIKVDGSVSIGDLIVPSTTTAGQGHANNSPSTGQTIGRALSAATTAGDQIYLQLPG